jgi:hypothetical protein
MRRKETKTIGIQPYIIDCMAMNLHEDESLNYLDKKGYDISRAELYRLKQEVKDSTQQRLNLIASKEFLTQHMERIDTLRTINNELWDNYRKEKDPSKRVQILKQIAELQLYLSSYYDSTRYVLERGARIKKEEQRDEKA